MKVAHIKNYFLPLTETFIYNYIDGLKKYKPFIISEYQLNNTIFPVKNISTQRGKNKWFEPILQKIREWLTGKFEKEFFFNYYYLKTLKKINPEVVHVHFGFPGVLFSDMIKNLNFPLVVSFYGYDLSSVPFHFGQDIYSRKKLFLNGQIFTAEGQVAKERLVELGCPKEKVHLLRIGIRINDYKFFPRFCSEKQPMKLLFCGRFVPKKGIMLLIESFSKVLEAKYSIELNIIGFGPQEFLVKELVTKLSIEKNVNFLGKLNQNEFIALRRILIIINGDNCSIRN